MGSSEKFMNSQNMMYLQIEKVNGDRFLKDFHFVLSNQDVAILRSQFVTSSWGGRCGYTQESLLSFKWLEIFTDEIKRKIPLKL